MILNWILNQGKKKGGLKDIFGFISKSEKGLLIIVFMISFLILMIIYYLCKRIQFFIIRKFLMKNLDQIFFKLFYNYKIFGT